MKKLIVIIITLIFIFEGTSYSLRVPIDSINRISAIGNHFINIGKIKNWDLIAHPEKKPLKFSRSYSGIRGIFGRKQDIPEENKIIALAHAYTYAMDLFERRQEEYPEQKEFILPVGRDTRVTSMTLEKFQIIGVKLAAEHMKEKGVKVEVINLGIVTTPFIETAVRKLKAHGGIMVTASHNSPKWNGFKYLTGLKEPEGTTFNSRGSILNAPKMRLVIKKSQELLKRIAEAEGKDKLIEDANKIAQEIAFSKQAPESLYVDRAFDWYRECVKDVFGLTEKQIKSILQHNENQGLEMVFDANGGAGYKIIPAILGEFIKVKAVNTTPGRFRHKIEPVDTALNDVIKALNKVTSAMFGLVVDCDADRGNIVIKDLNGNVKELHPQEVVLLNVACMLAWAKVHKDMYKDKGATDKPWRVVVHSANSGRVAEIVKRFGGEVVEVDIGEVNLTTRMHELENQGYFVPIGVEGYSGGIVFMGTEVRDGTLTALMSILALSEPKVFKELAERMGKKEEFEKFAGKPYSFEDILNILPKYYTIQKDIIAEGATASLEEIKERLQTAFNHRIINISQEGIFKVNGLGDMMFKKYEFRYYEETKVFTDTDERENKTGGFKIVLADIDGNEHFLWFRGSKTESGIFRAAVDSPNEAMSKELALLQESIYQEAVRPTASDKEFYFNLVKKIGFNRRDRLIAVDIGSAGNDGPAQGLRKAGFNEVAMIDIVFYKETRKDNIKMIPGDATNLLGVIEKDSVNLALFHRSLPFIIAHAGETDFGKELEKKGKGQLDDPFFFVEVLYRVIRQSYNVLKPGGALVINTDEDFINGKNPSVLKGNNLLETLEYIGFINIKQDKIDMQGKSIIVITAKKPSLSSYKAINRVKKGATTNL